MRKPPVSDMFPNETLIVGSFDMIQCTIFSRWKFTALQVFLSEKLVIEMVQI